MAVEFRTPEPVTEELLLELSRLNPACTFERSAAGELIVSPPVGTPGSVGEAEIGGQLWAWNKAHNLGFVMSSSGAVTLSDTAITVPDAAFVSHERMNAISAADRQRAFYLVCPDAVFELLSPSDNEAALDRKVRNYIANGARIAVKLNPRNRTLTILRPAQSAQTLINPAAISFDPELPGFTLDVCAVFDAIESVP